MHDETPLNSSRKRTRRRLLLLYPLLFGLSFIGIGSAEPRLWGIPLWYLWAGAVVLALVPLNLFFVMRCWPEPQQERGANDV